MPEKRLVIVDGYSLLFRAFFATRFLSTSDGRPTNALHGFTGMMFQILEKLKPTAIVVALDPPGKTFRHADYVEYKGTRRETAPELISQLDAARAFIAALGIPTVEVAGFEADDVVGTISMLAESNGYETTIVTGDLDALQLVDDHVSVLTPKMGMVDTVTYDPAGVQARFGFGPLLLPDYKALKGDSSDNIPGIAGIGDKSATEMIQKFGTVEEIIARFDELDDKYKKKLEGQADAMKRWKYLATIVRDVPLEYNFLPFLLDEIEYESAVAFLESYEMRSHVKRAPIVFGPYRSGLAGVEDQAKAEVADEVIEVKLAKATKLEELEAFVGGRPYAAYFPASAAPTNLFDDPERVAYVAIGSEVREVSGPLAAALIKRDPAKAIMHDAKPLYRRSFGMERIPAPGFDSMLAGFVLQSTRSNHSLRDLVSGYLEVQAPTTSEQMAAALGRLAPVMRERIEMESQTKVLDEIELPLIPVLARMETLGVKANRDGLREFSKTLSVTIEETQRKVHELAGVEFNIGSPKQLGELLFEKMALPGAVKTKTGYATGVEVLGLLAAEHEIVRLILNYRELTKLKSTYADALERLIQEDGRIHTTYNQTGAATGRLSSNDPNLQNIPIRTELGRGIRRAFVADDGYELASLDYSQIELRVLADMCKEPALVQAFETGEDVHTVTAKKIFNLGDEAPTKAQRGQAKMLNYAVLYGVTEYGLAQQLGAGFSIAEAKELIKSYHERFPSVTDFTKSIIDEAKSKGFTTTYMGRRRYFPDIHAAKINERRYAERQAMNAPLQGTAADMLKLAMLSVDKLLIGSKTRMLLNVHDELVFEMPPADEPILKDIAKAMDSALPMSVPIEVDAKVGPDWDAMRAVEV